MMRHRPQPPQQVNGPITHPAASAASALPAAQRPVLGYWISLGVGVPLALLAGWWLGRQNVPGLLTGFAAWFMPDAEKAAWYLSRASGMVAYWLLTGSTVWGLVLSSRVVADRVPPPLALALHSALAWLAIGFAAFHALVLLGDRYYTYRIVDLLVPFAGPYRAGWVGLGILGLYGAMVTSASFGLRRWIGQRWWRRLHTLTFAVYVLVTLHGLRAGTDSANPGARAMYLVSVLVVLLLVNYRLLAAHREQRGHSAARPGANRNR